MYVRKPGACLRCCSRCVSDIAGPCPDLML